MIQILRLAAIGAGAAWLAAAPLQARTVGGWEVAPSKQGACMMTATFEDESIALVWNRADQQLGFLAASKRWNGLMKREGDPTSLHLTFNGAVRYPQWVHQSARFQPLRGTEAVMGVWGPEHREELIDALTRSSQVSLKVGETDLGSFDISGAGPAYRELLRCGERG
jgi:hypothetical protein